ncbi:hypothetical protein INR49_030359 [Caranx melampygus]|nr:hypothetical protein INR49_030359 [Caranx melampygus]
MLVLVTWLSALCCFVAPYEGHVELILEPRVQGSLNENLTPEPEDGNIPLAETPALPRCSFSSVVATPAASPPPITSDSPGRIHHLAGSLGASQPLPRGIPGDGSWEALG